MKQSDSQHVLPRKNERRHNPRLRINPLVYARVAPDNGGILLDFGDGGMCISLAIPHVVSSRIHFSLAIEEHQQIEGTGHIRWVSESGRRAGVQFAGFSDESRARLRGWLAVKNSGAEEGKAPQSPAGSTPLAAPEQRADTIPGPEHLPTAPAHPAAENNAAVPGREVSDAAFASLAGERKPEFSFLAPPPPRPSAMPPEQAPPIQSSREASLGPAVPDTPLFFLPQRREAQDAPSWGTPEHPYAYSGEETNTASTGDEDSSAFRSAILATSNSPPRDTKKKSPFRAILLGTAICTILIALSVAFYGYPGSFRQFSWFPAPMRSEFVSPPPKQARSRRDLRRAHRRPLPVRDGRAGQPVTHVTIFYGSPQDPAHSSTEAAEPFLPESLTTVTRQNSVPGQAPPATSAVGAAPVSGHAAPLSPGQAVSMSSSVLITRTEEPTGALRSDGALVEEGTPISMPLHLASQTSVPEPIVVDAVIGMDGRVRDVRLISSPASQLARAVVEAVSQWRYRPFYENGAPAEFTTRITFDFSGNSRKP